MFGQTLPQIGDYFQGGIVYYLDEEVGFGLICSETDALGLYEWGCHYIDFEGTNESNGFQNTLDIINQDCQPENGGVTAAQCAFDYEFEGYIDWYLPSTYELQLLYDNVGPTTDYSETTNFVTQWNAIYTTSNQCLPNGNYAISFNYNSTGCCVPMCSSKNYAVNVRPIRKFLIEFGCTDVLAFNYDNNATFDDSSCLESIYGCTNNAYLEFDSLANIDNGNCLTLWVQEYQNLSEESSLALSSLQQALDTWNTTIDLSAGWNMFGYGCPSSIDVAEGLSNHTESIIITKDNSGNVYMPEFGFNGIGDFTPGFGYQIKLTEAIEGFSLCDWYVNDIPEDNIVSIQEENDSLQAIVNSMYGCTSEFAINYDSLAIYDDGSCEYLEGCTNPLACNYDSLATYDNNTCAGLVGCMDSLACNYDINSTCENGSCVYPGCTDELASNYEPSAACNDNSCIPYVGMYGFGGVVYKVLGNDAWIINIHEEISSSNHASSVNNYVSNLTTNGYNDWDLPSTDDWDDICSQKFLINITSSENSGLNLSNNNYVRTSQQCTISNVPYLASYSVSSCAQNNYTGNCSQTFLVRTIRQIIF